MKISYKVPLVVTLVILSAFSIFGGVQYKMIIKNISQQTENNLREVSGALNAEITQWLNEHLKIVSGMADILGDDVNKENIYHVIKAKSFTKDVIDFYTVLENSNGEIIASSAKGEEGLPEGWDGRKRPWYKLAMKHNSPMMTAPYKDSGNRGLLITAVKKLGVTEQNPIGVLAADIRLKDVSEAVNAVNFNGAGYAYLLNTEGKIITFPNEDRYGKTISQLYSTAPQLTSKVQENKVNGIDVLTAFYPIKNFKGSKDTWYIGVILDKEKVFTPAKQLLQHTIIAAVITALVSIIIFYLFMWSILIKPVNRLVKQADEISRGDLDGEIDGINRKDEIGELAHAVQRMEKALNAAMSKLLASRNK